jgi:hypothetical protein
MDSMRSCIDGGRLQITGNSRGQGTVRGVELMIVFTLRCARGYQSEGWFRDGDGHRLAALNDPAQLGAAMFDLCLRRTRFCRA